MSDVHTGADESGGQGGRTLAAAVLSAPMSLREAVRVTSAVADLVVTLHAAGRAHGGIGPATVLVRPDGSVTLAGQPAPKSGVAAPPALRADDLHGVGRVLASTLGWADGAALPMPIAELLRRAEATDAPAAALYSAVRRLEREPLAVASLLPPTAPARRAGGAGGALARMVPRSDRRTTGVATAAVAGAAAVGAVLLLIGAPAAADRSPVAPAAAATRVVAPAADGAVTAADASPTSVQAVVGSSARRVLPVVPKAPARRTSARSQTTVGSQTAVPSVEIAVPRSEPSAAPTAAPPSPGVTASPSPAPSATPAPEPSAAPSSAPSAAPSAPQTTAPSPPSAVPTETTAPAPSVPGPEPTTTAG